MNLNRLFSAALIAFGLLLIAGDAAAQAEPISDTFPVECKIALRFVTSPDYIKNHRGEIPDADKLDDNGKMTFVADLFRQTISKAEDRELFCANTIRENLGYTNAYHFPQQCVTFLPLLKKSFEDKINYKKDIPDFVQKKMDEEMVEMLVLDETAPDKLVQRCEVGIRVMQVDLNDRHLKEKYPLPVKCEVLFDGMEKSMILPSELETIRRQRVIFAIENKDTPKKLDEICEEISR